jgi:diguanylate cyclase (GGDEF)-like protein
MVVRRLMIGLLSLYGAASAHAAPDGEVFARDLALAREEAYVAPSEALRRLDALKAGRTPLELGQVLAEMSPAYYWQGRKRKAVDVAIQAENLARELHDDALLARAMLAHGYALSNFVHDQETAHRLVQQAEQLASTTRDAYLQTKVLVAEGLLAEEEGRTADGIEFVARALALARFASDPDALSMALREQARQLAGVGDDAQAFALTDELVALAQARAIPAQLAHARLTEYAVAARAGRGSRAESALKAALDILQTLNAQERLAVPLANLAELYTQAKRYREAQRTSHTALQISRELGDQHGIHLASFQLGMAEIYLGDVADGRTKAERALDGLQNDERYVRMLLDYGHAMNQVGEGDVALTVYEKAGSVSLAAWRKEQQLSYQALQRAHAFQRKQGELARKQTELTAMHHEAELKAAELDNTRRQRMLWVLLSSTTLVAVALIAFLYRRVAKTNRALQLKNEQLFTQSTRDSLTGLFNRHYFYEHVVPQQHAHAVAAAPERRADADPAAGGVFLLFDIDHFKSINDRFGHAAGDAVLKTVADRLSATLRDQDVLIRWGGEEFLAWLPGLATDEIRQVCTRLLAAVGSTPIPVGPQQLTVTMSIGFCPKPAASTSTAGAAAPGWEQLVHLADLCLYLAKTAGRNQAFGISDASALTDEAIAAADADMRQASSDGLVDLVNVRTATVAA